ncbi:MAG: SIR2 family protein [Sulfolobaceae archaeon]|nr:SIR2 family protein [Sulfolobales archaeon]
MSASDGSVRRELERKIDKGDVFFFAGSGISKPSGVPMANVILEASARAFLPQHPLVSEVISQIQPEKFYEKLLELTKGDKRRLALWRLLSLPFQPNINHYFMVKYSYQNRVPLFTTNFDTLFEKAAARLGIKCNSIEGIESFDKKKLDSESINLIKLHGTIGSDGEVSQLYVMTTEISKFNPSMVEFIQEEMERRSLVIAGYSGRDLDLFPFIQEKSKISSSKEVFWINKFENQKGIDYQNALSIGQNGASIVYSYPDEYLKDSQLLRRFGLEEMVGEAKPPSISSDLVLELQSEAKRGLRWGKEQKLLFLGSLLLSVGKFREAQKILKGLDDSGRSYLTEIQKCLLAVYLHSASHNLSEYTELKRYADRLSIVRVRDRKLRGLFRIIGVTLEAEFHRMLVPYMSFIYEDFAVRLFQGLLLESYRLQEAATQRIMDLISEFGLGTGIQLTVNRHSTEEVFQLITQQNILEHLVRSLSTKQQLVKHLTCIPDDPFAKMVLASINDEWIKLRDLCYRNGYYFGVASCHRHQYRTLSPKTEKEIGLDRAKSIAIITNLETTKSLVDQQLVDFYMRCGKVDRTRVNEQQIIGLFKESLLRENYLNALKSFLALLEFDRLTEKHWEYTDDFRRRAKQLDRETNGGLRKTLNVIKRYNPVWNQYLDWLKRNSHLIKGYLLA